MKKLLKLLSAALITAAMFMSCGNPASTTVPDQDDGLTVEQFIEKLIEFSEGVTTDEQLKLRFYKLDNGEAAFDICPQKDNYEPTAEKGAFNLTHKLEKYYNNKYVYEKNMFYFSLSENKLTFEYADVEEMKEFFNNAPNNTLYFFKQN